MIFQDFGFIISYRSLPLTSLHLKKDVVNGWLNFSLHYIITPLLKHFLKHIFLINLDSLTHFIHNLIITHLSICLLFISHLSLEISCKSVFIDKLPYRYLKSILIQPAYPWPWLFIQHLLKLLTTAAHPSIVLQLCLLDIVVTFFLKVECLVIDIITIELLVIITFIL